MDSTDLSSPRGIPEQLFEHHSTSSPRLREVDPYYSDGSAPRTPELNGFPNTLPQNVDGEGSQGFEDTETVMHGDAYWMYDLPDMIGDDPASESITYSPRSTPQVEVEESDRIKSAIADWDDNPMTPTISGPRRRVVAPQIPPESSARQSRETQKEKSRGDTTSQRYRSHSPTLGMESERDYLIRVLNLVLHDSNIKEEERIIDLSKFLDAGKLVGKGKYGDVHKAVWVNTPNDADRLPEAAIKVMRVPLFHEDQKKKRQKRVKHLNRELKVWQSLCHDNLLPLLGIAYLKGDRNQPCLVSKWMDNGASPSSRRYPFSCSPASVWIGSVMHFLERNPWEPISDILIGVAKGLAYLHDKGIVHGDLKGDNIVVDRNGNVFICDFGLSRMMEDSTLFQTSATHAGGTVRWCAPELISGEQATVTKEADIYAYAMTSFQIVSGQHPFAYLRHEGAVINAIAYKQERPGRSAAPSVSIYLWSLWTQCWARDPASRPVAHDMLETISTIDESALKTPILIRPSSVITCLAFSPSGKSLVVGHEDGTIRVWNTEDGTPARTISITGTLTSISFSPDRPRFAAGCSDGSVTICNLRNGSSTVIPVHEDLVRSIACYPAGSWIASCSEDETTKIWDPSNGSIRTNFRLDANEVLVSPKGNWLVAIQEFGITIWDDVDIFHEPAGRQVSLWEAGRATSGSFISNDEVQVANPDLRRIKIYNLATEQVTYNFSVGQHDWITGVSPAGLIACDSGEESYMTRLFNRATGKWTKITIPFLPFYLRGHSQVVFSPDGRQMAVTDMEDEQVVICKSARCA